MSKRLKTGLWVLGAFAIVPAIGLAGWLAMGPGPISYVWFVDGPTPSVAVVEHYRSADSGSSGSEYTLRVLDFASGEERGSMSLGNGRDGNVPRLFGPMGTKAWLYTRNAGLRLVDLETARIVMSREQVLGRIGDSIGGDLRLRIAGIGRVFDFPTQRLRIEGRDGNGWLLSPDLTLQRATNDTLRTRYAGCDNALSRLEAEQNLLRSDMRACFGEGEELRGLVQHASAAFGDTSWRGTFFDASGRALWTKDAAQLVGLSNAWFAAARPNDGGLDVLVASGNKLWALDMDPSSGAVRGRRLLR